MNRKRGKRQKTDPGQEVLVLPPNLLQKLGINLEKICINEDSSNIPIEDISEAPDLINEGIIVQDIISNKKSKQSSIIETANLMKKSLFLSPTFNTPQTVMIPNNLETGSPGPEQIYIDNIDVEVNKNINSDISNVNNGHAINCCIENQHIITQYSQDNQETSTPIFKPSISTAKEESISQSETNIKNKINILTEEIVDPTTLSSLQPLIDVNDRKAIPIDTSISINKQYPDKITLNNNTPLSPNQFKAITLNNLDTKYTEDTVTHSMKNAQTNGEGIYNVTTKAGYTDMLIGHNKKAFDNMNNVGNTSLLEREDTLNETLNKISSAQNQVKIVNDKAISEEFNTCSTSVNKDELESARTIANILFQHLNKEKNVFTSKQNKAKSKTTVQGVEKPGGELQLNRQLKTQTYSRNKKNNIARECTLDPVFDIDTDNLQIDYAENIVNEPVQIPGQLCICFDFGYLDRNIRLENYAHPHFSNTESSIQLDDALGIFIKDEVINRIDCDSINIEETSNAYNICYNALLFDSEFENEFSESNNKLIQDNTTPKTNASLSNNKKSNVDTHNEMSTVDSNDNNLPLSMGNRAKPAQVLAEIQTVQNMQQNGFGISDTEAETNENNQDKLMTKKRKLSSPENEKSKTDCYKRRKGRRSSRISNEKLLSVTHPNRQKVKDNEKLNSETIVGVESTCDSVLERDVQCAVCDASVRADRWLSHAAGHAYVAWPLGQTPLDITDKKALRKHLVNICDELGALTCNKCKTEKKNVNSYLAHTKHCKSRNDTFNTPVDSSKRHATTDAANVVPRVTDMADSRSCEVADKAVKVQSAVTEKTDMTDTVPCAVTDISDIVPRAIAKAVDVEPSTVAGPVDVVHCVTKNAADKMPSVTKDAADKMPSVTKDAADKMPSVVTDAAVMALCGITNVADAVPCDVAGAVRCGVCDARLLRGEWMAHAEQEHNYLAWIHGQPQLDLKDNDAVYSHLYNISKGNDGLTCAKCGLRRKYVKAYLKHIESCKGADTLETSVNDSLNQSMVSLDDTVDKANSSINKGTRKIRSGTNKGKTSNNRIKINNDGDNTINKGKTTGYKENTTVDKDNTTLNKDKSTVDKNYPIVDKDSTTVIKDNTIDASAVMCGVCGASVVTAAWSEHARTEHEYLAWTHGQTPLNVSDEEAVNIHLKQILLEAGQLICGKCDKKCKLFKTYLRHLKKCGASDETLNSSVNDTLNVCEMSASETDERGAAGPRSDGSDVTCGVCGARVRSADWSEHARIQHDYLAWQDGQTPLDVGDEEKVLDHLQRISRKRNRLICNKCGKIMKYAKNYLSHVKTCDIKKLTHLMGVLECAVCNEQVDSSDWQEHAMSKHYNIAWAVGETPVDIKNPFAAEKLLKDYKQKYNKLVCKVCGQVRVSCVGFYTHIIQCGKTDEELEIYKSLCDICNEKYLCVYHNRHMQRHREQELAKQKKLQLAERTMQQEEAVVVSGRRKAAEKAINVINKSMGDEDADNTEDAAEASKTKDPYSDAGMDSDASAVLDSESSSTESDASDHSALELAAQNKKKKKRKYPESHTANIKRIPFKVKNAKVFLAEGVADIREKILCVDELFPQWRNCELTAVSEARAPLYMPEQTRSCNVMIDAKEWTTYEPFEARVAKELSFFAGGCIQWISWAPARVGDKEKSGNYLAVAAHRGADTPRLDQSKVYEHPAMLQIWDFGDMTTAPKLSLCIALDCGTLWAGSWCPFGVRDVAAPRARLGLLALATSSGVAYILSVPYPGGDDDVQSDKLLYKVKQVAELRFSRSDKQKYQATSITWSMEKGHSVVIVGYSDGSLGYYNIGSSSPLLTEQRDGITIFYPYDEEYRHNSCITDVSNVYGSGLCSTSPTGSVLRVRGAAVRSQLPASSAVPLPLWPAALVVGNDLQMNHIVNELECWGAGRRLGALRCCGGCDSCGAVAAVAPPALRLMRLHPAYGDHYKTDIATIQVARLDNKRPKIKNDDLAVVIEPRTYEEAIKIYGVQFKYHTAKNMGVPAFKESCERFPLAEAVGVSFCPAPAHHTRLALALHCGLVLLLSV